MSGIRHLHQWEPNMEPSALPHRDSGAYPSPLPHPGPYAVASGSMEEAALRSRRPMPAQVPSPVPNTNKEQFHRFAGLGVGLASVAAEHVLSHPCIVLRRQCQVNHDSNWYHLTPFSLVQTLYYMHRHQSLTSLWKGLSSSLMVKGMQVAAETVISEATPLPREITRHSSVKNVAQHLFLKGLGFVVTCPFYASSLVETVQSEIASERPGLFDCAREGLARLRSLSTPQVTRQLPIWKVLGPYVLYGVGYYILSSMAQYTALVSLRTDGLMDEGRKAEASPACTAVYFPELIATFTGCLLADIAMFPFETVLHRLLLQGTRTIIDNTDTGQSVVPIVTRYEGFVDCFKSVIVDEGFAGLYKGFGSLIIQYACHAAILKVTKVLFDAITKQMKAPRPLPPPPSRAAMPQAPPSGYHAAGHHEYPPQINQHRMH